MVFVGGYNGDLTFSGRVCGGTVTSLTRRENLHPSFYFLTVEPTFVSDVVLF